MNPSYSLLPSLQVPHIGLYSAPVPLTATPYQVISNYCNPTQPSSLPPSTGSQPSHAAQPSYAPQQPAPMYPPLLSQTNIHLAPVFPYPSAPEKVYAPTPAIPYPSIGGSTYPTQPSYPYNSFNAACTPPSFVPLSHAQPDSGCPYPTLPPHSASNPKDSGAGEPSRFNSSQKSPQDSNVAQQKPTVRPAIPFNPQADAQIMRKAMKGSLISVDKKSIINVLTSRSNKQRLEIAFRYMNMYDKNLITALQNEFTIAGSFLDLMRALLTPLPQFLALEIHQALAACGSSERTLVEILCTASNVEIDAIRAEYKRLYNRPLEKDLSGDNCGNFERLLAYMVQIRRPENIVVDEAAATRDAQSLIAAGVLKLDVAETSFVSILFTRSYAHLRHVFKVYEQISGRPLEYAVNSQFSGTLRIGLLTIIQCVEDKAAFFADRIYDATSSTFGSNDRLLIRVIVSRCEIDLQNIKESYMKRYGKRMELDISRTTTGHYRKMLLALVGGYY